jgi:DNA-binding MarR family transcriptional regulator
MGYVRHRFDDDDGRVRLIAATEAGHLKVIEIESCMRDDMRQWLTGIDRQDLLAYIRVLAFISKTV